MPASGPEPAERPRRVDYRFSLANERTYLAWIRTALALDAAGVAVIRLLPPLAVPGAREAVGAALVAVGTVLAASSYPRWRRVERAMQAGQPLPASRVSPLLAVAVAAASLVAVVLLLLTGDDG
jgi:putative membrane protein